jgi:subtilisin family serine protease
MIKQYNPGSMKNIYFLLIFCIVFSWQNSPGQTIQTHKFNLRFHENIADYDTYRARLKGKKIASIPQLMVETWEVKEEIELDEKWLCGKQEIVAYISQQFPVRYIEYDYQFGSNSIQTDSGFASQWPLHQLPFNGCTDSVSIGAIEAWKYTRGENMVLGLIDTGVDSAHEDLWINQWVNPGEDLNGNGFIDSVEINGIDDDGNGFPDDFYGWNFVDDNNRPWGEHRHGTSVAGILAARDSNNLGIKGVAPRSKIVIIQALDEHGVGSVYQLAQAILYSAQMGIKITNNSWSRAGVYSQLLYDAIKVARDSGQLFITAAGNSESNNDIFPVYPANYTLDNILVVGASDCHDQIPTFSNTGANTVDVMAPGDAIYSTLPNNTYGFQSGTSMAAPFVAGLAALLWAQDETRTWQDIKRRILTTAEYSPAFSGKCATNGRVSMFGALAKESEKDNGQQAVIQNTGSGGVMEMTRVGDTLYAAVVGMGLLKYSINDSALSFFNSVNSPLQSNDVRSVVSDSSGAIWTGPYKSYSSGFHRNKNGSWTTWDSVSVPKEAIGMVSQLFVSSTQDIWGKVRNSGGILFKYSQAGQWEIFHSYEGLGTGQFLDFVVKDSIVWIGRPNRLEKYNYFTKTIEKTFNNSNSNLGLGDIQSISIDKNGKIWISKTIGKLLTIQGDSIYNSGINIPNMGGVGGQVAHDNSGNLWMTTYNYGLCQYDGTTLHYHNADSGLNEIQISSIYVDDMDQVWAGGRKGIYLYTKGSGWEVIISFKKQILSSWINSICELKSGDLYIGTKDGLVKKTLAGWEEIILSYPGQNITSRIYPLAEHFDGSLWVVNSDYSILRLKNDSIIQFIDQPYYPIKDIEITDSLTIWFNTNQGPLKLSLIDTSLQLFDASILGKDYDIWGLLIQYNPINNVWTNWFSENTSLPKVGNFSSSGHKPNFQALAITKDNKIWIGTESEGLYEFIPDAATSFGVNKFTLCLSDTLKLVNTTKEADSYLWLINDNIVSTDTHYQHIFTQPGKYKITLVAQDSSLGNRDFTQFVEVNAPISVTIPDTTVCGGGVFFFPQIRAEQFLWTNMLGDTLSTLREFIAVANGSYILQATDACGFTALDTFSVALTSDAYWQLCLARRCQSGWLGQYS